MSGNISVVVPTFNSSLTIVRALNSVVSQTLLPFEVIIIDNASTDNTVDVVNEFARKHPATTWKIEMLSTNVGPGAARNHGWDIATGELIAFLDSDDSWHTDKLSRQFQATMRYPNAVLFGHRYLVLESGAMQPSPAISSGSEVDSFRLFHFLFKNRISTPTAMVRRFITERFPTQYWHGEDYSLWLAIVANHGSAIVLHERLVFLHKSEYGASGLSANLQLMHRGEVAAVRSLQNARILGPLSASLAIGWLRLKYLRRRIKMSRRT